MKVLQAVVSIPAPPQPPTARLPNGRCRQRWRRALRRRGQGKHARIGDLRGAGSSCRTESEQALMDAGEDALLRCAGRVPSLPELPMDGMWPIPLPTSLRVKDFLARDLTFQEWTKGVIYQLFSKI